MLGPDHNLPSCQMSSTSKAIENERSALSLLDKNLHRVDKHLKVGAHESIRVWCASVYDLLNCHIACAPTMHPPACNFRIEIMNV